jgi:uncharacterized surface protein with fasciclin (FAS1) repeats
MPSSRQRARGLNDKKVKINLFRITPIVMTAGLLVACLQPMTASSSATTDAMVDDTAMYPQKNIIEKAVNSKDHTMLVAAFKAAGLVDTLSGPGPFTIFVPTDEAFAMLPDGTVATLLKPENKTILTVLTEPFERSSGYEVRRLSVFPLFRISLRYLR